MAAEGEENYNYMDDKLYEAARSTEGVDTIRSVADYDALFFRGLTPRDQSNALHVAAQFGNHKFISALLVTPININPFELLCKCNSKGETPLHLAAQSACKETIEALLNAHDNVGEQDKLDCWKERDNEGDTPLHIALRHGHNEIAVLILERNWQLVSICNTVGESPAYLAAQNFCPVFLQRILDADRDGLCSASFSGPFGQTAFHPARKLTLDIMSSAIERRKHLLKVQDNKGKTVVHYAVEEERISIVEILLKADNRLAYLHDNDGVTPLHIAASRGLFRMTQIILNLSPQSIAIRDKCHGQTALHIVKMDASSLEECLQSTRMKELINEVDNDGNTPLHLALINSDFATADKLLQVHGINYRLTNKQGYCPMDLCRSDDQIPLKLKRLSSASRVQEETNMEIFFHKDVIHVDQLLDQYTWDVCLTYKGPEGDSILHIAARDGNMNLVNRANECDSARLLLLSGQNHKGDTPLHMAAEHGQLQVVNAILSLINTSSDQNPSTAVTIENGDPNNQVADIKPCRMKSLNGDTPLHKAVRYRHAEVALLLLQKDPESTCINNNASESPFYLAADNGCDAVLNEMQSVEGRCAATSISGRCGQNVLHAAAREGGLELCMWLVRKRPELLKKVDDNGKTALHHAVEGDTVFSIKLILKQDKSGTFVYDKEGYTPLLRAAVFGHEGCMGVILNLCPQSAELRDLSTNRTVLHLAKLSFVRMKWLMRNQVAVELVNKTDKDGNTALHCAIKGGDIDKALVLLQTKGINWRIKNKQHQSPTDLCKELWRDGKTEQRPIEASLMSLFNGEQVTPRAPKLMMSWIKYPLKDLNRMALTEDENLKKLLDNIAVAAALLATITFAAAFTIPGGYDQNTGEALRIKQVSIRVFMASNILGMLMAISILFWYTVRAGRYRRHKLQKLALDSIIMLQMATVVAFISGVYAIGWHVKSAVIVPSVLALFYNLYIRFRPDYIEGYYYF